MLSKFITYLVKNQFVAGILFLAIAWLVFQVIEIIILLFASYIIMAALKPFISWMQSRRIPRIAAITTSYSLVLLCLILLIFPLIPFFADQVHRLFVNFPSFVNSAGEALGLEIDQSSVAQAFPTDNLGQNIFAFAGGVFGGFFSIVAVFVISIYLSIDYNSIRNGFLDFFPKNKQEKAGEVVTKAEDRLGAWVRGQIILSLFIGIVTWIALTFLNLGQYALPLAVLAGVLEIIPTIGPVLAAIPAIIIGLSISPTLGLILVIVYIAIQLLENNILVPRIMQKAVGLSPIVVIVGITIGTKFFGIAGALLSIPFISLLIVIYKSLRSKN